MGAGVLGMFPVSMMHNLRLAITSTNNMYKSLVVMDILGILGIERIVCVSTGH
jgi:hypothetical protein